MNNDKRSLDERQLMIRGQIFRNSLILMGSLFVFEYVCFQLFKITFFESFSGIVIFMITLAVMLIEMILRDAYAISEKGCFWSAIWLISCGCISLGVCIFKYIKNNETLFTETSLTEFAGFFLVCLSLIAIGVAFGIKLYCDKKNKENET